MIQNEIVSLVELFLSKRLRRMIFMLTSPPLHPRMKQNQHRRLPIVTNCAPFYSAVEAMTCQKGGLVPRPETQTGTM